MPRTLARPSLTLLPAYGRKYQNKDAIMQDWENGKDFQIGGFAQYHGSYTSCRDIQQFIADGYGALHFRCGDIHLLINLAKLDNI